MTASLAYGGPFVDPEEDEPVIDLEKVVEFIKAELPDVTCYVEQTGGGCATAYLGDSYSIGSPETIYGYSDSHHITGTDRSQLVALFPHDKPWGDNRVVMAGPGHFTKPGWAEGRAYPGDFSLGYDCNDPMVEHLDPVGHLDWSLDLAYGPNAHSPYSGERVIARRMIQLYRNHPRVKRGEVR